MQALLAGGVVYRLCYYCASSETCVYWGLRMRLVSCVCCNVINSTLLNPLPIGSGIVSVSNQDCVECTHFPKRGTEPLICILILTCIALILSQEFKIF